MAKPVSERERARIVAAIKSGSQSCGSVAREFGRSKATISGIAVAEGLTFERSATKDATEARAVDNAAKRAELSGRLLHEAEWLLGHIRRQCTVHDFTKDGEFVTGVLDLPPAGDMRSYLTAAAIAIDKSLALERHDQDEQGLSAVDAWLRGVVGSPTT